MRTVLLLGAGASKGTLKESAPTSDEFGQGLNSIVCNWRQEYRYLAAAIDFLKPRMPDTSEEAWALHEVWGAIDTRVKLRHIWGLSLPGAPFPLVVKGVQVGWWDPWGIAGFELRCVLARVYGEKLEGKIEEASKRSGSVKKELRALEPGDCVISFNYDLLAESVLDQLGKEWTRANRCYESSQGSNRILLCKLHGCLSWKGHFPEKEGQAVEILDRPMRECEMRHDEHPCLVAPVPFKSEIVDSALQLNKVPSFFHLLVAQWQFAIEYLLKADKLVVMGYGFPAEDRHAHYLFAEAAAKRGKAGELQIEVFETCQQRFNEVRTRIGKIFDASKCSYSCEYKGQVEA